VLNVVQLRETEEANAVMEELLVGSDNAMQVDCASRNVSFVVAGWFVFPKGSLHEPLDIASGA
jgi:hypothetical protein